MRLISEKQKRETDGIWYLYYVTRINKPVACVTPLGKCYHNPDVPLQDLTDDELLEMMRKTGRRMESD